MKNFLLLITLMFLISCSSSKQYYQPKNPQKISSQSIKDDQLLSKYKDYEVINIKNDLTFISNDFGFLKILKNNEVIFDKKFDAKIVGINTQGNKAIIVDAQNNIIIYDLYNYEYKLSQNYGKSLGIIKNIPNPIFTSKYIITPTLNGKLVIINNETNTIIKSFSIGTQEFFNNIMYLYATDEIMIAASSNKIVSVDDNKSYTKIIDIKKAMKVNDYIYILASDGMIYKYDLHLNEIASKKYKYANFNAFYSYNSFLYAIEYGGYLIKLDENLNEIAVFALSGKIANKAYFINDALIYDNKKYKLQ